MQLTNASTQWTNKAWLGSCLNNFSQALLARYTGVRRNREMTSTTYGFVACNSNEGSYEKAVEVITSLPESGQMMRAFKILCQSVTSQYERLAAPRSESTTATASDSNIVPGASSALTLSKYRHTAA